MQMKTKESTMLRSLKGIGAKTESRFERLGIHTTQQLIYYFPRAYERFEQAISLHEIKPGKQCAVKCRIGSSATIRNYGKQSVTILQLSEGNAKLQINWFHMPYLRTALKSGRVCIFVGTVRQLGNRLVMDHPKIFDPEEYAALEGKLLPIYSITEGLSNRTISKAVGQVLADPSLFSTEEYLPEQFRTGFGLASLQFSLEQIHFPNGEPELTEARRRLVFDEFFLFLLGIRKLREQMEQHENHFPMKAGWLTEEAIRVLPFRLTKGQNQVWRELEGDLGSSRLMNRLIQGDVGSGKTILAFLAMLMAHENQIQSALMAPTEILASQHFDALCQLFDRLEMPELKEKAVLLTGSVKSAKKRQIHEAIRSGAVDFIIGTHALIQEKVEYARLGLVITDEQHRFGVRQRGTLSSKGDPPNVLVMSATPIPRTLAMILYGDLDISILKELPARRRRIKNAVVTTSYRPATYKFIEKEAQAGHQAYVICPLVEESENIDCENVIDYTERLREKLSSSIRVEMLHGRMKAEEKQKIMSEFAGGEITVLVSTTVVEVGVNVPNATIMMVENAERFGLAQLHQLRGRVGRGEAQSYCIFVQSGEEISPRLKILGESNDGFYIAEQDLKLRGPGELLGTEQSGEAIFHLADIYSDGEILMLAEQAASMITSVDPMLTDPEHDKLKLKMEQFLYLKNHDILL